MNYWIFHSSPEYWDSKLELSEKAEGYFNVSKKHASEVKKDDKFALWISGKDAGIYAFGEVKSEPSLVTEKPEELKKFSLSKEQFSGERLCSLLSYDEIFLQNPIPRDIILKNDLLKELRIFQNPQGITNFQINQKQFHEIIKMKIKNKAILNRYYIEKTNYFRKAKPNKYWTSIVKEKLNYYKELTSDNFYIIIAGKEDQAADYFVIPYKDIEQNLKEEFLTKDNNPKVAKRWIIYFNQNQFLKIGRKQDSINAKKYYGVKLPMINNKKKFNINQVKLDKPYITSLLTKPFVIITGNSGTGKTRIATKVAKSFAFNLLDSQEITSAIKKGQIIEEENAFYWTVEKYHLTRDRIIFKKKFSDEFFILPDYTKPDNIQIILDNGKKISCRLRKTSNLQPHLYSLKEVKSWLEEVGIGNLFKVRVLEPTEEYENIIQFEKIPISLQQSQKPTPKTYALVPVGADWTDNRSVVGFYDAINRKYRSTQILDLIIDANDNPDLPFFLILDEMNLSHVERYFSDFLSAMESGEPIPLHTIEPGSMDDMDDIYSDSGRSVPKEIKIPDNIFITGTVNIDETTYMFSPKVLDRANVLEFKVSGDDLNKFFQRRKNPEKQEEWEGSEELAKSFLELSRKARRLEKEAPVLSLQKEDLEKVEKTLSDLFSLLDGSGMEFAYRTAEEILRYIEVSYEVADNKDEWDLNISMDEQILQKILPKLYGSKRKMELLLLALASYCSDANLENAKLFKSKSHRKELLSEKQLYPKSYQKLINMIEKVRTEQFVSFI